LDYKGLLWELLQKRCRDIKKNHTNILELRLDWSHFYCPVIEHVIRIEHLLRNHLSYKSTFSLSKRCPLNTGFTVLCCSDNQITVIRHVLKTEVSELNWIFNFFL
jgi:hypothetical protein